MISEQDKENLSLATSSVRNDAGEITGDPVEQTFEPDNEEFFVTEALCDAINEYKQDHTYEETVDHFGVHQSTVYLHVKQDCNHEYGHIDPARCGVVREMARDGASIRDLGDKFGVHHSTVGRHIRGDCSCEHSVPPADNSDRQRKVTDEVCDRMRTDFDRVGAPSLRDRYNLAGTNTVYRHVNGDCACDSTVEPVTERQ